MPDKQLLSIIFSNRAMTRIGNPRDGSSHDSPTILKARDTPAINSEQLDTHHADSGCCESGTSRGHHPADTRIVDKHITQHAHPTS